MILLKPKTFALAFLVAMGVFVGFHGLTWELLTKKLLSQTSPYFVPNLGRLGYLPRSFHPRQKVIPSVKHAVNQLPQGQKSVDMITVGDSFSYGLGAGENPYYQDHIHDQFGLTVMQLDALKPSNADNVNSRNFYTMVKALRAVNYFKRHGVRYFLIEFVEEHCCDRQLTPEKVRYLSEKEIKEYYKTNHAPYDIPKVSFINTGNFKVYASDFLYAKSPNAFGRMAYRFRLKRPFFTVPDASWLLVHNNEFMLGAHATPEEVASVNDSLNTLSKLLRKDDVQLIVLPIPGKYTTYWPYLSDQSMGEANRFFQLIRPMPKDYHFVDSLKILRKELKKGVMDLYYADDTHWSARAIEAVVKTMPLDQKN